MQALNTTKRQRSISNQPLFLRRRRFTTYWSLSKTTLLLLVWLVILLLQGRIIIIIPSSFAFTVTNNQYHPFVMSTATIRRQRRQQQRQQVQYQQLNPILYYSPASFKRQQYVRTSLYDTTININNNNNNGNGDSSNGNPNNSEPNGSTTGTAMVKSTIKKSGLFSSLSSSSSSLSSSLSSSATTTSVLTPSEISTLEWEVYVDQSKLSLDRGGSATLDAFIGLAPPNLVSVKGAIFPSPTKNTKSTRGPAVRCIALLPPNDDNDSSSSTKSNNKQQRISTSTTSFDVGNVDSVDKVHRILTKYMQLPGISLRACDCLKWKYRGNGYLEAGKIDLAIDAYDKALETSVPNQEGIILLMRATAYLQRAASHRTELKSIVNELATMVPNTAVYRNVYQLAIDEPYLANGIFRRIVSDTSRQEDQFRRTQYKHGLYQYSLLQAAQDSLRATQLLEHYSETWIRAAEILSELWKIQQAIQYYNKAIELDVSLSSTIVPIIERLYKRQELLTDARAYGWSEDTLRLALDVAR